jgi:hypothetical protein
MTQRNYYALRPDSYKSSTVPGSDAVGSRQRVYDFQITCFGLSVTPVGGTLVVRSAERVAEVLNEMPEAPTDPSHRDLLRAAQLLGSLDFEDFVTLDALLSAFSRLLRESSHAVAQLPLRLGCWSRVRPQNPRMHAMRTPRAHAPMRTLNRSHVLLSP